MSKSRWLFILALGGLAHAQDTPVVLYNDAVLVCDETGCRERSTDSPEKVSAEEGAARETKNHDSAGQDWSMIQFTHHTEPEQPEKKEETERAERDVNAQEAMVWWAGISTGVAFFALVGLFVTLWETRRIGQAQTRGYVEAIVKGITVQHSHSAPGLRNISARCVFRAHGHSPVYAVRPNFRFNWVGVGRGERNFRFVERLFPEEYSMNLFPGSKPTEKTWGGDCLAFISDPMPPVNNTDIVSIQADMSLHWRDVFGNLFRQGIRFYGNRLSDYPHTIINIGQQWTGPIERIKPGKITKKS